MNLKDFSLMEENQDHYVVGHPGGKSLKVPKAGLSDKAQSLISGLKREQHLADGTPDEPLPAPSQDTPPAGSYPTPVNTDAPQSPDSQPNVTAADEQGNPPPPPDEQSPTQQMQVDTPAVSTAAPPPMASPDVEKGLKSAESQIQGGVNAVKKSGEAQAVINTQLASDLKQTLPSNDQNFNKYQGQDDDLFNNVKNGNIDPNHFVNNMSLGSKITSSIGILLGGLGSGLTGGPNLALQKLNQSIANDIDAQKNDQSKKMNLWKMNRERMGDSLQADLTTSNQLKTIALAKLESAKDQALGPVAQQNAAMGIMSLKRDIANNNWMRSRSDGNGAPGSEQQHIGELQVMQQMRPDLYKDMEGKYIPGVGTTRVAATPDDKKTLEAFDEIQKAVTDAKAFQNDPNQLGMLGALPFTAANDIANSKKTAISLGLNKLNGLNRLNETEFKQFQGAVNEVGSPMTKRANAQLDELSNQIQRKKQTLYSALGVQPFRKAAADQQAIAWAHTQLTQDPNNAKAKTVLQLAGQQ